MYQIKQEQAIKGGAKSEIKTEVEKGEHVKERKPLIKSTWYLMELVSSPILSLKSLCEFEGDKVTEA